MTDATTRATTHTARALALLATAATVLFGWIALNVFGFHRPMLEVCFDLAVLIALLALLGVPLAWVGTRWSRRKSTAFDEVIREQLQRILTSRTVLVVFQPIVDCRTGSLIGFEALARFKHIAPAMTPEMWFSAAERVGLGTELELLTARVALEAARDLPDGGYLSVNLSPAAIFTGQLPDILREAQWPPSRLVLEVTEHRPIDDYRALSEALAPLRRDGLRLAVDDAGAGYASFRHILDLAPDYIKLDRTMVSDLATDPRRQALITAITAFATKIGATVVAEGVENPMELRAVQALGVHAVQGYLTGHPQPAQAWAAATSLVRYLHTTALEVESS